ncbi:MAG TPA: homoserine O-succinyltransferase [Verrucomicrobiae bacterium]|nr:homoserine O-succinyltransferase [Verrucomicrobiae bacterium]
MSISLPAGLPARRTLLAEGIEVLDRDQLRAWGRRPLRVCLVNLMPNKPVTETQIARLLGAISIPVELTLCLPDGYRSRSTPVDHLAYYRPWSSIRHEQFHALIVTGAPLEALPFEDVAYWPGLCAIFDWARARAISALYICWAAQAALYHRHGVPKHRLPRKMFGIFRQRVSSGGLPLLRGFGGEFPVPVSRHTEVRAADLPAEAGLTVLASSAEAGLCLLEERDRRAVYMFNHLEYDAETLRDEFLRDRGAGKPVDLPRTYFPGDDPERAPVNIWRPYGHLLFANWLGEIHRTAWPRVSDEPVIQWALAGSREVPGDGADHADLLIEAAGSQDILPSALAALAAAGFTPRRVKVHRQPDGRQLIELGMEPLEPPAIERIARRLCVLAKVLKVAFRTGSGVGGWLVGHSAGVALQSNAPSGSRAPSEAA